MMRLFLVIFILQLSLTCLGASIFEEAYQRDVGYQDAVRGLTAAADEVRKTTEDMGASLIARLASQEAYDEAAAQLRLTTADAQLRVLQASAVLLEARKLFAAGDIKLQQVTIQKQAAELRFKVGSISQLELSRVAESFSKASAEFDDNQRMVIDAETSARALLGELPEELPSPPALIDLAGLNFNSHPQLIAAQHKVAAAKRAVDLAQGPDTAVVDREARERELVSAEANLPDIERVLQNTLDNSKRGYLLARNQFALSQQAVKLAEDDLRVAEKRYQAGAISRLALVEAQYALAQSQLYYQQALNEIWLSHYRLMQAMGGTP